MKCLGKILNSKDIINKKYSDVKSTYSTSETIVGKWIDGKPIYRKTIYISALPSNDEESYNTGITNMNYLVNMYGTYSSSNSSYTAQLPINFVVPDSQYIVTTRYMKNTNQIRVLSQLTSGDSYSGYVTLEYTKTTD